MACFHPWRMPGGDGQALSCGQCRGCRKAYHREWSMRCMHEASMHDDNCFLTLTYDDEHLPPGGTLCHRDFQLFMKRLRKEVGSVRYYMAGEYGENSNRPHYHALLFGYDPPDKALLSVRGGFPVFTSERMRKAWALGLHELGSVTPQSAGYVTRYITRRMTGGWAKAKYGERVPEYGRMSRNPGIGARWIDQYRCEVYPADSVVVRGALQKPPRYYDLRSAASGAALDVDEAKIKRFLGRKPEEETPARRYAREVVMAARDALQPGGGL